MFSQSSYHSFHSDHSFSLCFCWHWGTFFGTVSYCRIFPGYILLFSEEREREWVCVYLGILPFKLAGIHCCFLKVCVCVCRHPAFQINRWIWGWKWYLLLIWSPLHGQSTGAENSDHKDSVRPHPQGEQLWSSGIIHPLRTRCHHTPPKRKCIWHYHPDLCYQTCPKCFRPSRLPPQHDQIISWGQWRSGENINGFAHILQSQVLGPSLHFHRHTPLELRFNILKKILITHLPPAWQNPCLAVLQLWVWRNCRHQRDST